MKSGKLYLVLKSTNVFFWLKSILLLLFFLTCLFPFVTCIKIQNSSFLLFHVPIDGFVIKTNNEQEVVILEYANTEDIQV